MVACGCLTTPAGQPTPLRLQQLGDQLGEVIKQYRPDSAVVEQVFFGRNRQSAMVTAEVSGVLRYLLATAGVQSWQITPPQVKRWLTGDQRADKQEVEQAVRRELRLTEPISPDDAVDALGIAWCGFESRWLRQ